MQSVRVLPSAEPPDVYEPIWQVVHMFAPESAYLLSTPQSTHFELPDGAKVPGEHLVKVLDDPHAAPLGHSLHSVLVTRVPPLVKDPVGHTLHASAFPTLYFSFAPHGSHRALSGPL